MFGGNGEKNMSNLFLNNSILYDNIADLMSKEKRKEINKLRT